MKVGFITNIRAPYRTLQMNEFSKIKDLNLTIYYTNKLRENRTWEIKQANGFKEVNLNGVKISSQYGYINSGIVELVKNNDMIILGGYDQPTMIIASLICRLFKKKYILLSDGISTNRLNNSESGIKKVIKSIVINNSSAVMANGSVGRLYFEKIYNYPTDKIYNQYLTVDGELIKKFGMEKEKYRSKYREKLNISNREKVLIYSGRLIDIKNVESVIKAISKIEETDITLLITGGGKLEESISNLAKKLKVKVIITGFIGDQKELFKHYFAGDALILPSSVYEVWGLVINEAMYAGLPVLVSEICGCSLDLVDEGKNGYTFNPNDLEEIKDVIYKTLYIDDYGEMGNKSKLIIDKWNFENSKREFLKILKELGIK